MSRRSDSGAPSSDAPKDTGSAPDVLSVLEKHFSPDPLRESGGWTPRTRNQAPAKDDVPKATVTPEASTKENAPVAPVISEAPTLKDPSIEEEETPRPQAPTVDVAPDAAAPSNPTPSKWFKNPKS
ncbi:unnamed protein product [Linum trigynum]|uniref:Uncharacterized protein n=1 Tax=Linum trigynum TaxID=586398 RepID=A0AAV2FD04_9ROSI